MLTLNSIRQFVRAHPWKVSLVAIAAILYIAFNIWVYYFTQHHQIGAGFTKSGGFKTNPSATITEKIKNFGTLVPTPPAKQDPAPRDTPKTGPGPHGCDPYGCRPRVFGGLQ